MNCRFAERLLLPLTSLVRFSNNQKLLREKATCALQFMVGAVRILTPILTEAFHEILAQIEEKLISDLPHASVVLFTLEKKQKVDLLLVQ